MQLGGQKKSRLIKTFYWNILMTFIELQFNLFDDILLYMNCTKIVYEIKDKNIWILNIS